MTRKFTAALVAALLLVLCATLFVYEGRPTSSRAADPSQSTTAGPDTPYGITITGSQFATGSAGSDFAHNLQVSWARIQIRMCDLFPKGSTGCKNPPISNYDPSDPNNYDWTIFDQDLMNATAVRGHAVRVHSNSSELAVGQGDVRSYGHGRTSAK